MKAFLRQLGAMFSRSPKQIKVPDSRLVIVTVEQKEFDKIHREASQRCAFPPSYTQHDQWEEWGPFNDTLDAALSKHFRSGHDLGGDYFLDDDWYGEQCHSAGLYSAYAHCLEFLEIIDSTIQTKTKRPAEWVFHIACECQDDEIGWGEVLIHAGIAYVCEPSRGELTRHFLKRKLTRTFSNLFDAVRRGKPADIQQLLAAGAYVNDTDGNGNRPIHYADTVEKARILVEAGADLRVEDEYGKWPVENTSEHYVDNALFHYLYDLTHPLHGAVKANHLQSVRELAGSIDVNSFDRQEVYTPLLLAASAGHLEIVKLLQSLGADIHQTSRYGWTPLGYALGANQPEVAEHLLREGARPNAKHVFGAAAQSDTRCLEILVAHGVNLNVMGEYEKTPLHEVRSSPCAEFLIQHGAPLNKQDTNWHWSPLHVASMNGYFEIVKLLLDAGADPNLRDKEGLTPRDHALKYDSENPERKKIDELLRSRIDTG